MSLIDTANPLKDSPIQVLDPEGNVVRPELVPAWNDEMLRKVYADMIFLRIADKKAISLQRQGRCGSYLSIEGQEAAQAGAIVGIERSDTIFPSYRETGALALHGVPLEKIFLYWMGSEWGSHHAAAAAPISIVVGSHPLHATGYAWALKLQKKPQITVSFFGDGATSEGDFYEALNFAGVFKIPTVFFCQNNQWAISVPRTKQSATATLAQKALAGGIRGVAVDGNDIFAVSATMSAAAADARAGKGACLIEAVTYRMGSHSTSDDAAKYRDPAELEPWRKKDPILRLKLYLQKKNLWSEDWESQVEEEARARVTKAAEAAEQMSRPVPSDIFDFLYEKPTLALEAQKAYLQMSLRGSMSDRSNPL